MRGPGEKWTEYYPASYTDTIVLVREPRLLVLEKAYANAAFDGLASLVVVWTRLGTGCFTTVVLNDRNSKIAVHYLRHKAACATNSSLYGGRADSQWAADAVG
jgi:hypothetical protein